MQESCEKYSTLITGFIDGELDEPTKNRVKLHLEGCSDCNQRYIAESDIKKLVQERCKMKNAPGYLKTRVRHNLNRQGARPSFWQLTQSMFSYRPVSSSFAVAFIVVVMFVSLLYSGFGPRPYNIMSKAEITSAILRGEIICLDCEYMESGMMPNKQEMMTHRLGIRAEDASIWTFLYSGAAKEMMGNHELLKKRISVSGTLFPQSHYMQVKEYQLM